MIMESSERLHTQPPEKPQLAAGAQGKLRQRSNDARRYTSECEICRLLSLLVLDSSELAVITDLQPCAELDTNYHNTCDGRLSISTNRATLTSVRSDLSVKGTSKVWKMVSWSRSFSGINRSVQSRVWKACRTNVSPVLTGRALGLRLLVGTEYGFTSFRLQRGNMNHFYCVSSMKIMILADRGIETSTEQKNSSLSQYYAPRCCYSKPKF